MKYLSLRKKMESSNVFIYQTQIKERHLDTFGHVNNATYLELFEEARWELLLQNGMDLKMIHKTGIGPVVLECQVKFIKELTLRECITIKSKMLTYENKVGIMQQEVFNANEELCTQAKFIFGVFDMKARKLISPPQEWRLAIGLP